MQVLINDKNFHNWKFIQAQKKLGRLEDLGYIKIPAFSLKLFREVSTNININNEHEMKVGEHYMELVRLALFKNFLEKNKMLQFLLST